MHTYIARSLTIFYNIVEYAFSGDNDALKHFGEHFSFDKDIVEHVRALYF